MRGPEGSGQCTDHHPTGHLDCTGTAGRSIQATYGRAGHRPSLFRGLFVPFENRTPLTRDPALHASSHFACCSHTSGRCQNEPGQAFCPLRHILRAFLLFQSCIPVSTQQVEAAELKYN